MPESGFNNLEATFSYQDPKLDYENVKFSLGHADFQQIDEGDQLFKMAARGHIKDLEREKGDK